MKNNLKALLGLLLLAAAGPASGEGRVSAELVPPAIPAGGTAEIRMVYAIPEGLYQNLQEEYLNFTLAPIPGITLGSIEYPPGEKKEDRIVYQGNLILQAPLEIARDVPVGEYTLTFTAHYQLCDEAGLCFAPEQEEMNLAISVSPGSFGGGPGSILWIFLMAFIGGLLLNLMPCVLPVLSLKALSLVNQRGGNRRKLRLGGLLYAAGVILSLLILGMVVVALKLTGEQVGWGFQFQNPPFLLFLAVLTYLFALSLFEVFILTAPGGTATARLSSKKGALGSFFSGVFAVLLATPCTAPLLGPALGFAFSQPPAVTLLIFLFVGLGLALPFLLLGFFPKLIKKLPKAGPWMNRFRQIMGFLLLATTVWLLSVLRRQIGGENLMGVLAFLFLLGIAAWLYGWLGHPAKGRRIRILGVVLALSLAFIGGKVFINLESPEGRNEELSRVPEGWEPFSPEGVEAVVSSGEPAFLAFGAAWCLTCKTSEGTVLLTDWGDELFEQRKIKRFYGDYTRKDPVIARWIAEFDRAGVPLYVYYAPGADRGKVLPEILTRPILKSAVDP